MPANSCYLNCQFNEWYLYAFRLTGEVVYASNGKLQAQLTLDISNTDRLSLWVDAQDIVRRIFPS